MKRLAAVVALSLSFAAAQAGAARREGVDLPDRVEDMGWSLVLNGVAVRTVSFLDIRVYVAALYLAKPNHQASGVLNDPSPKRIDLVFLRRADQDDVVRAWRGAFELNCKAPCGMPSVAVDQFLAAQRDVGEGDHQVLRFDHGTVSFAANGREVLRQQKPDFARLVLETFIGQGPPSTKFRAALLGVAD
jgi:Chalcone isomerase-like